MIKQLIKQGFFDRIKNVPPNIKLEMLKEAILYKLANTIEALMQTGMSQEQANKLIEELQKRGYPVETMSVQDIIKILQESVKNV